MSSGSLLQLSALLAIPLALWPIFRCQPHTLKVKPLNGAILVVTSNHLTKRHTLTVTVDRLTRVYSCRNGICYPCIARSSQMNKLHSRVCIAPLPPAAVLLWGKTYIHLAQVDQHKALWVCQEASSALPGDCLRLKTDTTCTNNIIMSLQGWCCDEVKIQTQCKKIVNNVIKHVLTKVGKLHTSVNYRCSSLSTLLLVFVLPHGVREDWVKGSSCSIWIIILRTIMHYTFLFYCSCTEAGVAELAPTRHTT